MALTAIDRLIRRCNIQPNEVGMLQVSATILDRSKSIKTEFMPLLERSGRADTEGADHYDTIGGGSLTLQDCLTWTQGAFWDGRWAVAVCSDVFSAPVGHASSSAGATAILFGRAALVPVSITDVAYASAPKLVSGLYTAPLPHSDDELQPFSNGQAISLNLVGHVARVHKSSPSSSLVTQLVPRTARAQLQARPRLSPSAFAATCAVNAASLGHFGSLARSAGMGDGYYLQEIAIPTPDGASGRGYGCVDVSKEVYVSTYSFHGESATDSCSTYNTSCNVQHGSSHRAA
jgi:hypothetical protein